MTTNVTAFVVCSPILVALGVGGGVWPGVIGLAAVSALLISVSLIWRLRTLRTVYDVSAGSLTVRRGSRVIRQVPLSDIRRFDIVGVMDGASPWRAVRWPPTWPQGRVVTALPSGKDHVLLLPPVLLWGRDQKELAEKTIRQGIGLAPGLS